MPLIDCSLEKSCRERKLELNDAIELLGGKWKLLILQHLSLGAKRFKDLQADVKGISPKVLTTALQALEQNMLIIRTVNPTKPVTVSYMLTEHAQEAKAVFDALSTFGAKHRKKIRSRNS